MAVHDHSIGRNGSWGPWPIRARQVGVIVTAYAALVLGFWALGSAIVGGAGSGLGGLDETVAEWMVGRRTETLNPVSNIASGFSDTATVVVALAVLAVGFLMVWRHWGEAMLLLTALGLEVSSFVTVSYLVGRDRPDVVKLDPAPPTSSFPSGHVAAAVALYGGVAYVVFKHTERPVVRALAAAVAVLAPVAVALSRMYRGMHYLTDVIAGAALGGLCLVLAIAVVRTGLRDHGADEELVA